MGSELQSSRCLCPPWPRRALPAPEHQEGGRALARSPERNSETEDSSSVLLLLRVHVQGVGGSAHAGRAVFLVEQCPPLLALSHKHAQTRGWEGHRRGLGAGWALLRQPRTLQAAGRTRPGPGDTEGRRLPRSPLPRAGQRTAAWARPSWWRCLPGVHTQCASEEGHSAPRQAGIAAAQLDEPLAQALLRVSRSLTAHRVLSAQPVCVVVTWLILPSVDGSPRDLGSPSTDFLPACPPHRARARGDSHDEGCNAYGPDVSLRDSTLALQELWSW